MSTVIGTTLKGRYQVDAPLGEGGGAQVFRGIDTRLGRPVVIKILRAELASRPDVVARFQREATDAASLSHPCIVQVYDIEEEGGLHFIVMEYCDGGDLKRQLGAADLSMARVFDVSQAVLMALAFAHEHGIVHRDVKPHNILLASPNQVKLGDFGIARAYAADTVTQSGTFVGSAAYLSPEQAQGFKVGPASDLYSFGVVLFEMLTGRLPFDADNPVTLALKHVQENPPSARVWRPDRVSEHLDGVLRRALSKDPAHRFQSAADFWQALAAAEPAPAPTPAPAAPQGPGWVASSRPMGTSTLQGLQVTPIAAGPFPDKPLLRPPDAPAESSKLPLIWLGLLAIFAVLVYYFWQDIVPNKTVPDLVGKTTNQARSLLDGLGLHMRTGSRYDTSVPAGTILEQDKRPGLAVRAGEWVQVVVSQGSQEVDVPNVVGLDLGKARTTVEDVGFKVTVKEENSPTVPEGNVIEQTPAAGSVAKLGTIIDLTVSKGPALVAVPDLSGKPEADAKKILSDLGLGMEVLDPVSDATIPKGSVVSVRPAPGSMMHRDGTVQVVLSLGAPRFVVPGLLNLTYGAAKAKCQDAGFTLQLEGSAWASDEDTIISQNPGEDAHVNLPSVAVRVKHASTTPTVTPTISTPVDAVLMPYLVGSSENDARAVLAEKGLTVAGIEQTDSDQPVGTVVKTFPEPGVTVQSGQSVTIYVSNGQASSSPEPP